MSDKISNNQVTIMGEIISSFSYSHEVFGEGFYMMNVQCKRLGESYDIIPVMVSERLMDATEDYTGKLVCVNGQFRSYNCHEAYKNRVVLYVFAREVSFIYELEDKNGTNQTFWMGISAKSRFTGKHLLEERLQSCCLP